MHQRALASLKALVSPVTLIDAVKVANKSATSEYVKLFGPFKGQLLFNLQRDSVLIGGGKGSPDYNRFLLAEFPSGKAAAEFLTHPEASSCRKEVPVPAPGSTVVIS
jgi:hypothetical protein